MIYQADPSHEIIDQADPNPIYVYLIIYIYMIILYYIILYYSRLYYIIYVCVYIYIYIIGRPGPA